jgi:hypothetical protein
LRSWEDNIRKDMRDVEWRYGLVRPGLG